MNLLERRALSLLVLIVLVFTPLMLLALTPWVELRPAHRAGRQQGSERISNHQRWDPRTGVVGRSRRDEGHLPPE